MPALAAIQYSRDGFDTRTAEIMGRRMAGERFLQAWIDHSGADPVTGWADVPAERAAFLAHTAELGARPQSRCATPGDLAPLHQAGALWLADPSLNRFAWARRWERQDAYSLVGITHTICTHAAMDRITDLLTAPIQRWDALICTSHAVRQTVQALLNAQAEYLKARLGATVFTGPELPVIPLGVPCDALTPDPTARARWRAELEIAEDDVAVLQFGRLSLNQKAHPTPLYQSLARAAARGGPRLHLILAGTPMNEGQGAIYRMLAEAFPAVTTHFVDGARADAESVRSAADIGTLLSDNIQESFGLAPVELMAAGLPVVASDWDGLRDTIEHGVTGFRCDTIQPMPGAGEMIARRYASGEDSYQYFLAQAAQLTAVDIGQAAEAFARLAADPALRARMGAAARDRARRLYDWPVVIGHYRDLLAELAARRGSREERAPRRGLPQPARPDPFHAFAGYPTHQLRPETRLMREPGAPATVAEVPGGLGSARLRREGLPPAVMCDALLTRLAEGEATAGDLLRLFPGVDPRLLLGGMAWMIKFGFIRRV